MRYRILKKERLQRELTLKQVQDLTDIPATALSRIERGIEPLWPAWRKKLGQLYSVEEEELLREASFELVEVRQEKIDDPFRTDG